MTNKRVAIIGCGRMGQIRAWAASRLGAEVIAVCDVEILRAQELASRHETCLAFESHEEIPWNEIDALFICTPPHLHKKNVEAAVENGIPVLIEKPLASSLSQAEEIARLVQSHTTVNAVGYMNRYRDSVQRLRREIAELELLGGIIHWLNGRYRVPWWQESDKSGGPINEQATHIVDTVRYLFGEVVEVHAIGEQGSADWNEVDTASFQLRMENGALVSAFYSCRATEKMIGLRVFTPEKVLALNGWDFQYSPTWREPDPGKKNEIFVTETSCFFAASFENQPGLIQSSVLDAIKTQRVVEAVITSLQTGEIQKIEH